MKSTMLSNKLVQVHLGLIDYQLCSSTKKFKQSGKLKLLQCHFIITKKARVELSLLTTALCLNYRKFIYLNKFKAAMGTMKLREFREITKLFEKSVKNIMNM